MEKGHNRVTDLVLKLISEEDQLQIDEYLLNIQQEPVEDILDVNLFNNYVKRFFKDLSPDDLITLRYYTGYDYKNINSFLRRIWNYEDNGKYSEELGEKYLNISLEISSLIKRFPSPDFNFYTYRGVNLDAFSSYDINSLEELTNMTNKYMYEQGFTSTSLKEESSYFKTQDCNIEIRYLIPKDSKDGISLINDELSYSTNQNEYLLDKGSLSKIIQVEVDKENNKAYLYAILIPKRLYDYEKEPKKTL